MPEKSSSGIGISSGSQLPQSVINIPASGFSLSRISPALPGYARITLSFFVCYWILSPSHQFANFKLFGKQKFNIISCHSGTYECSNKKSTYTQVHELIKYRQNTENTEWQDVRIEKLVKLQYKKPVKCRQDGQKIEKAKERIGECTEKGKDVNVLFVFYNGMRFFKFPLSKK